MTNSFDLTDLDQLSGYSDTEVPEAGDVPDGRYTAFIDKVEINKTKNDQRRLSWQLKIIGPSYIGRVLFASHLLETKENLKWLKRDLKTAGIELANWAELPSRLPDFLDIILEVQVKTKGDYTNAYFRKRVELGDGVNPRDLVEAKQADGVGSSEVAALFDDEPPF